MSVQEQSRRAPTLEEVAAAAGVSRSTVSRVINGGAKVSPDVLRLVSETIDRLEYTPNRAARSLVKQQTMAIALVIPEDTNRFFGDPFFASIVSGITQVLEDSDYVLNLQLTSPATPSAKTRRYLLGGNVDGAIVVSHHSGDEFFTRLDATMPVVFGGRPFHPEQHDIHFVDVDNAAGAELGVQHLISLGRRRIGYITGPADMQAAIDRTHGWRRAMRLSALDDSLVEPGDFSASGGAAAMRRLLERAPDLDAVFAASDLTASGAMGVLHDRGIRVPDDVAVVGFDDSPAAVRGEIGITTVRQPSLEMGREMARMLLGLLRDHDAQRSRIMPTELVRRASA